MTLTDPLLYSLISVFLSHHQRSFLLPQTGTDAETLSQTLVGESLGCIALDGVSSLNPFPMSSGHPTEEKTERLQDPEGIKNTRRTKPSETTKQGT